MKVQTRILVYPYKMGSESGKKIAAELDAKRVFADKEYHPKDGDVIVDWGCGYKPTWAGELWGKNVLILNHWEDVCTSVNKVASFKALRAGDVPTPPWTMDATKAQKWLQQGSWVCCRQVIEGKDGEGLILAKKPSEFVHADLYTLYMPIENEYRVYVFGNEVLDVRHKRRDQDAYEAGKINEHIRTTSGNWVFCQHGFKTPVDAPKVAIAATKAMGLEFAGVDIIQAKEDGKCYVLETNTAPYLGDNTVPKLAAAIIKRQKEWFKNL